VGGLGWGAAGRSRTGRRGRWRRKRRRRMMGGGVEGRR